MIDQTVRSSLVKQTSDINLAYQPLQLLEQPTPEKTCTCEVVQCTSVRATEVSPTINFIVDTELRTISP